MTGFNPQCITYTQMNLIFNARYYYRRLTTWTRAYLMSRYYGIGTEEAQFERLYQETVDIGEMLQIIFGRQASEYYSQLVSQYAIQFHQLISAQLEGNVQGMEEALDRLYRNVEERADYLESINPYWSAADYRSLFDSYIQHIIGTANAISSGDVTGDIHLYDMLNEQTNRMGDTFAEGIYDYVTSGSGSMSPDEPCITYEEMDDIYTIRMLWFGLTIWIRVYMLSRFTKTGDPEKVFAKLMEVPVEYVNTMKKYFPQIDEESYLRLFTEYIELISAFITAMMENNEEELNRITRRLYENADERAEFVASINPLWTAEQWKDILYINIRSTIEEAVSFLTEEYEKNIDIFTRLLDQAETSSAFLARGLFDYITQNRQTREDLS